MSEVNPFIRLIGNWKTSGQMKSEKDFVPISGMDRYEWILNESFILHRADVMLGNERSETLEIIKPGHSNDAIMKFFNNRSEEGIMRGSILNNEFRMEGDGLRFIGTINDANNLISGKWYRQDDHKEWKEFIELTLEKQEGN